MLLLMSYWDEQFDKRIQYFNSGIICHYYREDNWISGNSSNLTSALQLKSRPVETEDNAAFTQYFVFLFPLKFMTCISDAMWH